MNDQPNVYNQTEITPCAWKGDKRWVYSITFDEALADLHQYTIPILESYGVPGHVEVVVGQMGEIRQLFESSYNGMRHMNSAELRDLLDRGWGIGNHSWSHTWINMANAEWELKYSKQMLEEAIGQPITIYCSPGENNNASPAILERCREYGYLGAMTVFEALNRPEDKDPFWLNRTFLHDQGPNLHDSEFNPYRQIMQAQLEHGWIIDYTHCPMEKTIHPRKDCSAENLERRVKAVVEVGSDEVWLSPVDQVVDYRYMQRHLKIEALNNNNYRLSTPHLPTQVRSKWITLRLADDCHRVELDGRDVKPYHFRERCLVDLELQDENLIQVDRGGSNG
jgi:peptidoglycan/xylan/chitin deacetylase (PgdA/CDA1 family)